MRLPMVRIRKVCSSGKHLLLGNFSLTCDNMWVGSTRGVVAGGIYEFPSVNVSRRRAFPLPTGKGTLSGR